MFFKGFRGHHDWPYCTVTKLLTFSTTLVPVVFRSVVMSVFKMIYSMYGCTVEPLQTNKVIFVYFYCAVQMLPLLGLTVPYISCTVAAVSPQTAAVCSLKHLKYSALWSQSSHLINRPAHWFFSLPELYFVSGKTLIMPHRDFERDAGAAHIKSKLQPTRIYSSVPLEEFYRV